MRAWLPRLHVLNQLYLYVQKNKQTPKNALFVCYYLREISIQTGENSINLGVLMGPKQEGSSSGRGGRAGRGGRSFYWLSRNLSTSAESLVRNQSRMLLIPGSTSQPVFQEKKQLTFSKGSEYIRKY
jgi:hypothetical protein